MAKDEPKAKSQKVKKQVQYHEQGGGRGEKTRYRGKGGTKKYNGRGRNAEAKENRRGKQYQKLAGGVRPVTRFKSANFCWGSAEEGQLSDSEGSSEGKGYKKKKNFTGQKGPKLGRFRERSIRGRTAT